MEDDNRKENSSSVLGRAMCKANNVPVTGDQYRAFVRKIEQLLELVKTTKQEIDSNGKEVTTAYTETIKDIKRYREDINAYLNKMEHDLLERCYEINQDNEKVILKLDGEFRSMKYELDNIYSRLTSHEKQSGDMVLLANTTSSRLKQIVRELNGENSGTKLQLCTFKRSKVIRDMMLTQRAIGKLEVSLTDQPYHFDRKSIYDMESNNKGELKVKSLTDKKECYITSIIVLSSDTVACTDWANNSVKIVDTRDDRITSEFILTSQPWDITSISNEQMAVTVTSENKIQFLYKPRLTKSHSIDVTGRCRGIAYNKDKLVVSYDDPSKVEVLNMCGRVLQCLKSDRTGSALFERPYYVTISGDGDSIYVSDNEKHSVTRFAFDGQLLSTYKDTELRCPRGLVVCRDGSLLVCSSHGHSVHLISSECSRMKIMLRRKQGGEFCQSLCYSDAIDTLYLSSFTLGDQIRIYKFT